MPISAEAVAPLGALLSGTEAKAIAERLEAGHVLSQALQVVSLGRRPVVQKAVSAAGLSHETKTLAAVCRAIQGARSARSRLEPAWTLPGHLAQAGPLTSSVAAMVTAATTSVTCSTYNFQHTSGLWTALSDTAQRLRSAVRVYVDTGVNTAPGASPSLAEIAQHLGHAQVFRTLTVNGKPVRNHAKFVVVDHRFVVITSANFSAAAEHHNVELGVRIDDRSLAELVERQVRDIEGTIYTWVQ